MSVIDIQAKTPLSSSNNGAADVVAQFEAARGHRLRRKAWMSTIGVMCFFSILIWALDVSGFLSTGAGENALSNIADLIARMNPALEWNHLFADRGTEGSIAHWYNRWPQWQTAMIETIQTAIIGTLMGAALGLLAAIMTARTTMPYAGVRWTVKRILELIRTVPLIILAIIFVALFGLGPVAGVLALILTTMASMGRIFSEVLENIDEAPRLAIRAAGGNAFQQFRYGVFPQVAPVLISFTFLFFEISVGSATTLGLVGAGGIGAELMRALVYNQYQSYLAILILIVIVVILTDWASEYVRHRMAEAEAAL